MINTNTKAYRDRLVTLQTAWWKKWLDVQAPYRWNIRRIAFGTTLEIGCGIGRNLLHLSGNGTGIDHNQECVTEARKRGLAAFTPDEFYEQQEKEPTRYDNLLLSHVLEHMTKEEAGNLLLNYKKFLKPDGKIIVFTPQERGYKSDSTHVTFMDFNDLAEIASITGFQVNREYSFPFSRWIGKYFLYNEFVSIWKNQKVRH